jgi:hypothetical protein
LPFPLAFNCSGNETSQNAMKFKSRKERLDVEAKQLVNLQVGYLNWIELGCPRGLGDPSFLLSPPSKDQQEVASRLLVAARRFGANRTILEENRARHPPVNWIATPLAF